MRSLDSLPEPFQSWTRALRYRPLLWLAGAVLLGVAWGGYRVSDPGAVDRGNIQLYVPVLLGLMAAGASFWCRWHPLWWRVFCAGAVACCFCAHTSRRLVPPAGDISLVQLGQAKPRRAYEPTVLEVQGVVVDHPRRGNFAVGFPLECTAPYAGRVWVSAPYKTQVQVGDEVRGSMELMLPRRPGSPAERAEFWGLVESGCWIEAKSRQLERVADSRGGISGRVARGIASARTALLGHYERAFGVPATAAREGDEVAQPRNYGQLTAQALTAIVFGQGGLAQPLPMAMKEDFRRAGLTHLLVASGTQAALLCGAILMIARGMGLRRWPVLLVLIPSLVFYALLAGSAASIWRAVLVGVLMACALLLGRPADGLSLWALALVALLVWDPAQAWSLSFQFTFAATFGLLVFGPGVLRWLEPYFGRSWVMEGVTMTLGAQCATLLLSLYHFGTFSVVGLGANLLAIPLASLLVFSGTAALVLQPLNVLNFYLVQGLVRVAHKSGGHNGALWEGEPVSLRTVILMGVFCVLALAISPEDWKTIRGLAERQRGKWVAELRARAQSLWRWPTFAAAGGLLLVWMAWAWWPEGEGRLRVTIFDVGQGESILVQGPKGGAVLVDGGTIYADKRSDVGSAVIVPELERLGVQSLDMMVLTHADEDHCSGLAAVAREIPVRLFLDGPSATRPRPDPTAVDYLQVRRELARLRVPVKAPAPGEQYSIGGATFTVLSPMAPPLAGDNDNAIVARVEWGKTRVLLTADAGEAAEERLLERRVDLKCTVLKVGHHGSESSTSREFLAAAGPKFTVISCGKYNPYGHPARGLLRRLDTAAVPPYRTDVNGTVTFECGVEEDCVARGFR